MGEKVIKSYVIKLFENLIITELHETDNLLSFKIVDGIIKKYLKNYICEEKADLGSSFFRIKIKNSHHVVIHSKDSLYKFLMSFDEKKKEIITNYKIGFYDLRMILFWEVNYEVTNKGGVILHASSVLDNNEEAILFVGDPGTGKTTRAKILRAKGYKILSDDILALFYNDSRKKLYCLPLSIFEKKIMNKIKNTPRKTYEVQSIFTLNEKHIFDNKNKAKIISRNCFLTLEIQKMLHIQMNSLKKICQLIK
ncbi:MAG: hypothetical protein NZL96_04040 [Patescibacteria group bacterium]|nr:hypothetical protein [Patescibacteria group bacterium]